MYKADVIIIGGGLAGLTAGIHLVRSGLKVLLFEKEDFPHHKVCGEYVSKEILPYMEQLGVDLYDLNPPEISKLLYSTSRGNPIEEKLPLGGLGLSRYAFDWFLFQKARSAGVEILKEVVTNVKSGDRMKVETAAGKTYASGVVLGCFGKRSTLDKNLKRSFFQRPAPWLAVKSHYKMEQFPDDLVALHNFRGGYCGLSKTESGAVNVCYLVTYKSFKEHKDPEKFKEKVLRKNPFLDEFFANAVPVFEKPLTIAQVSFQSKSTVEDHVLMAGDAAGLLHPLCGNGMAMAIHSAKIASESILTHLSGSNFDRQKMEKDYVIRWKKEFGGRLRTGKFLQKILLSQRLSEMSQRVVSAAPFVLPQIIKQTHGKPIE